MQCGYREGDHRSANVIVDCTMPCLLKKLEERAPCVILDKLLHTHPAWHPVELRMKFVNLIM